MSQMVIFTTESTSGLQSKIDLRFGRSAAFVVVDLTTEKVTDQFSNNSREASHGAGIATAAMIAGQHVTSVVSGRFGPKAYEALEKLGVTMWIVDEPYTVADAVLQLKAGNLTMQKIDVLQ